MVVPHNKIMTLASVPSGTCKNNKETCRHMSDESRWIYGMTKYIERLVFCLGNFTMFNRLSPPMD